MNEFVPASQLYDVESRTPIAHPAHQATDEEVQRALEDREIRADGGHSLSGTERLRALDLFCGAGGASAGIHSARFDLVAGVDQNADALQSHNESLPSDVVLHDLQDIDLSVLPTTDIDYVHGSPPCQGFSQAKGRRDADDEKNELVFRFIDWLEALQPRVATMENVTGMATISSTFMDQIAGAYRDAGYAMKWRVLNAADYGVPQTRERIFCVAVREHLSSRPVARDCVPL